MGGSSARKVTEESHSKRKYSPIKETESEEDKYTSSE
jgi:hypothetical protein